MLGGKGNLGRLDFFSVGKFFAVPMLTSWIIHLFSSELRSLNTQFRLEDGNDHASAEDVSKLSNTMDSICLELMMG